MPRFAISTTMMMLGLALGSTVQAGAPIPVTTCGQDVQGTGQLTADLNCAASADEAVKLKGTLLLGGFILTGNPGFDVVRCVSGACRIVGPGTVTGGADGIRSDVGARVEGNANVVANAGDGVRTEKTAKITGAYVSGNGGDGVRSKGAALLKGSNVIGNGGTGVRTDGAANVQSSNVGFNDEDGVHSEKTAKVMKGSVVANDGFDGVRGLKVQLKDSLSVANGTDPACGVTDDCADLAAQFLPKVQGTASCGSSRNTELGGTWGVCGGN